MALQGDLKSINLGNVLQDIAANALTGTLTLTMREHRRVFWFDKGKLRLVGLENGKGPSPLNGLLALGKVKPSEINPEGGNVRYLRGLVRKSVVTPEEVKAALEHQMIEFVCDVFAWGDAHFEFTDGEPDEDAFETSQLDHDVRLAPDSIIMEAARRVDEWSGIRKIIFSPEEILVLPADRTVPEGDPVVARIAGMLDGQRRLRDILDQTHLGEFVVLSAAAALLRSGTARALTVEEATENARRAAKGRKHEQALRMARFGLERMPSGVELLEIAAEAHEALGRTDEAASAWRKLAAAQVATAKPEEALATYRKVVALAPQDTFAQERIFDLLIQFGRKGEAAEQGEALVASYKRAGLPDEMQGVFTRLMKAFGDDDDFLEQAAATANRLGERKEALALYRRLFERALDRGDREAITARGKEVLRLDQDAADVTRRLKEVETGAFHEKRRQARKAKLLGGVAIALAVIVPLLVYELRSRSSIAAVRKEAITKRKEGEDLLRLYNGFLDDYGWSLSASDAKKERNEVENAWVETALLSPEKVDGMEEQQLLAAKAQTETVRDMARQPESKARAASVLERIDGRVTGAGDRFVRQVTAWAEAGTPKALGEIAKLTDPLALRAAQQAAAHGNPGVRKAGVAALGGQPSIEALGTLVKRFAAESDPGVKGLVREEMRKRTGQDAGEDAGKWQEHYRRALAEQRPGLVPPLNASLVRVSEAVDGQPLLLEWRLENFGASPIAFQMVHRLDAAAEPERALKVGLVPGGAESRRVELRGGEFIGGRFDARKVVEGLDGPATTFSFVWTARVQWAGAAEYPVESVEVKVRLP
jgi:tetratricopeptide (TPR) repeat protein